MEFNSQLFDSHCHLSAFADLNSAEEYINTAKNSGIVEIWDISTNITSSLKSIEFAKKYPEIKSFIGVDPELFEPNSEMFKGFEQNLVAENIQKIEALINANREYIFGIGETGIDNYWIQSLDSEAREISLKLQTELFIEQIELSKKFNLPLSIHSRSYEAECLEILKRNNAGFAIFHSFTGTYEVAKKILDAGYGLGVNGIITFKNAHDLRKVYKKILGNIPPGVGPKYFYDKGIFFETDAPFLSPEGKRGELNEPANIKSIYNNFLNHLNLS